MRKANLLYAPILACAALFSLVFSAWANAPLPPPHWIQPYDEGQEVSIGYSIRGTTWTIYLYTPGPCDYTCTLYGPGSDTTAAASISGSLEKFGPQRAVLTMPLKAIEKEKSVRYRVLITGNYYTYKKVPASAEEKKSFKRHAFEQVMGDPNVRYELIDKKGRPFTLDKTFVISSWKDGSYYLSLLPSKAQ